MKRSPRVLANCVVVAALALSQTAQAHHYNRGHLVTDYAPCLPGSANTSTSDGVAACSPPVPVSDCATSPTTALRLGSSGATSFLMQVSGRRRTRIYDGNPTLETRVLLRDVQDCSGESYKGQLDVRTILRVHSQDPACSTGMCTLPDISFDESLTCGTGGFCKMHADASQAFAMEGIPPLPVDHGYTAEVVALEVLDLAGKPFLATGLSSGDDVLPVIASAKQPRWLDSMFAAIAPPDAEAYGANGAGPSSDLIARYIRSFAPCLPADTDTTTGDGQAACVAVAYSDCSADPVNAVIPVVPDSGNFDSDTKGRGKIDIALPGDETMVVQGYLRNLLDCSSAGYSGPLQVDAQFRTTVRDAGCSGGVCTLVDGPLLHSVVQITGGSATVADPHPFADLNGLSGPQSFSAQVINARFLDRSGNAVLTGPSLLVRCNSVDGAPFCFGN